MTTEEIFLKAVEMRMVTERAAFLDGACGTDAKLRAEVESLLASDEEAGGFLEEPLFNGRGDTIDQPSICERPGTRIGRYRLLERIGEGGFGVVFMAEQKEPFKRRVALKIIKPGMDTQQVIARFEAERQALAMMDHPNIAKVLDAGATDSGRPYFVMELVNGISITQYCDERELTTRERLELFIPICQAVQHAHQKGIIHHDLDWLVMKALEKERGRRYETAGHFAADIGRFLNDEAMGLAREARCSGNDVAYA